MKVDRLGSGSGELSIYSIEAAISGLKHCQSIKYDNRRSVAIAKLEEALMWANPPKTFQRGGGK